MPLRDFKHLFKKRPVLDKPQHLLTEEETLSAFMDLMDYKDGRRGLWTLCLFGAIASTLLSVTYLLATRLAPSEKVWLVTALVGMCMPTLWGPCYYYVDRKCEDYYLGRHNERAG